MKPANLRPAARILRVLKNRDATCKELAQTLSLSMSAIVQNCLELSEANLIHKASRFAPYRLGPAPSAPLLPPPPSIPPVVKTEISPGHTRVTFSDSFRVQSALTTRSLPRCESPINTLS